MALSEYSGVDFHAPVEALMADRSVRSVCRDEGLRTAVFSLANLKL
jgi:hypothetical protein